MRQRPGLIFAIGLFGLLVVFMWRVLWPPAGQALGGFDVRGLFYPWFSQARTAVHAGQLPLWDAHQFAGYPFLSNPQVAFFYPPAWIIWILPVEAALSWFVLLHLWLAAVGMWLFVRALGGTRLAAALAGLAFAFSGFMSVRVFAGHVGLIATDAWLPWLLLATVWAVRRRSAWAGIVAGVPFGLAILAGHTTSLLYVGLVWASFALFLAISEGAWKTVVKQVLLAGGVGVLLSSVQLFSLVQFSTVSSRAGEASYEFATGFSFPPAHLVTFLVPEFFGEPTRAGYWSVPNFEELTYYMGILPLLGLILALRRPSKAAIYFVLLMVFGVLLAFGSYGFLYRVFYDLLPPFQLARAPARALFMTLFAGIALLATAVSQYGRGDDSKETLGRLMPWVLGIGFVAGISVLAATGAVFMSVHPSDTSGRLWHQLGGWALATGFFVIGGLLLWQYLVAEGARRRWLGAALLVVLLVDLWTFGMKFIRLEEMRPAQLWTDAVALIGTPEERVLPWGINIFDQNGAGQVGLYSVFGYNALEIGANIDFVSSIPDPRSTAYDILGARYVIATNPLDNLGEGERPLTLVGQQNNTWVYERARTLPLVRLVTGAEVIPDREAAIGRVHQPDFDPATTAILAQEPGCALDGSPPGTAEIVSRADGLWQIRTNSPGDALLVLSETAYPGWQVRIDGEEGEWMTAYTAVRAVCVPAGEHLVEWVFAPRVYWLGGLVTLLMLVVVGTATAVTALRSRR